MVTCPFGQGVSLDDCEFCVNKEDCILLSILSKLETIEARLDALLAVTDNPTLSTIAQPRVRS